MRGKAEETYNLQELKRNMQSNNTDDQSKENSFDLFHREDESVHSNCIQPCDNKDIVQIEMKHLSVIPIKSENIEIQLEDSTSLFQNEILPGSGSRDQSECWDALEDSKSMHISYAEKDPSESDVVCDGIVFDDFITVPQHEIMTTSNTAQREYMADNLQQEIIGAVGSSKNRNMSTTGHQLHGSLTTCGNSQLQILATGDVPIHEGKTATNNKQYATMDVGDCLHDMAETDIAKFETETMDMRDTLAETDIAKLETETIDKRDTLAETDIAKLETETMDMRDHSQQKSIPPNEVQQCEFCKFYDTRHKSMSWQDSLQKYFIGNSKNPCRFIIPQQKVLTVGDNLQKRNFDKIQKSCRFFIPKIKLKESNETSKKCNAQGAIYVCKSKTSDCGVSSSNGDPKLDFQSNAVLHLHENDDSSNPGIPGQELINNESKQIESIQKSFESSTSDTFQNEKVEENCGPQRSGNLDGNIDLCKTEILHTDCNYNYNGFSASVDSENASYFSKQDSIFMSQKIIDLEYRNSSTEDKILSTIVNLKNHNDGKPYKCEDCGKYFTLARYLYDHKKTHGDKLFHCEVCGKEFAVLSYMKRHAKTHSKRTVSYECEICGKKLAHKSSLKTHRNHYHSDVQLHICDICGAKFKHILSLDLHKKQAHYIMTSIANIGGTNSDFRSNAVLHLLNTSNLGIPGEELLNNESNQIESIQKSFESSTSDTFQIEMVEQNCSPQRSENLDGNIAVCKTEMLHTDCSDYGSSASVDSENKNTFSKEDNIFMSQKIIDNLEYRNSSTHSKRKVSCECEICGKKLAHQSFLKTHKNHYHSDVQLHVCDICGAKYNNISSLDCHKKQDHYMMTFKCEFCEKQFDTEQEWSDHVKMHSEESCEEKVEPSQQEVENIDKTNIDKTYYCCDVCGKQFVCQQNLSAHELTCTEQKKYQCDICDQEFVYYSALWDHKKKHLNKNQCFCDICGKRLDMQSLIAHKRLHSGEKPFQCDVCDKSFANNVSLLLHKKVHTGQKSPPCPICGKQFAHFKRHLQTHTGERPFDCNICGKKFARVYLLKQHMLLHSGKTPFKCDVCGKAFANKSNMYKHKRTHGDGVPFVCEFCGKSFKIQQYLAEHIKRQHSDVKYKCNICGKEYNDHTGRSKHLLLVHKTEKAYVCHYCGKGFALATMLKHHVRVHTGEKPYHCDICGKTFTHLATQMVHKLTHTGEKPHVCKLCGKRYKVAHQLKLHMNGHMGIKPYKCDICGKAFSHSSSRLKHQKIHIKKM